MSKLSSLLMELGAVDDNPSLSSFEAVSPKFIRGFLIYLLGGIR